MEYHVIIRGEHASDDGLRVEIQVGEDFWSGLQIGTCPDCGSQWVWAETGNVPGTRECRECNSLFTVLGARYEDDGGRSADERRVAVLRRERLY